MDAARGAASALGRRNGYVRGSSGDGGSAWYRDPDVLLHELQCGGGTSARFPSVEEYEDLRLIRRGGQGVVYSAWHGAMRRRVALKVLTDRWFESDANRRRFEREIDLVAGLQHPNIVRVYDRGRTREGAPFFSMEHIEGIPLDEYVRTTTRQVPGGGAWTMEAALRLLTRIGRAIHYAHQRGVIHRDLKPNNILIDRAGESHVVDFGLAKAVGATADGDATMTVSGEFMGTLAYASPEQLSGDPSRVDVRTDVHALGVILYELLTGARPFTSGGPMAGLIIEIAETDASPPSRAGGAARRPSGDAPRWPPVVGLNAELDTIVLKALAKDPERRYQSAAALCEDVERYLRGEAIEARRASAWYLMRKTLRRHRVAALTGTTAILALLGFGIAMALMYGRARSEARKANQTRIFLEDTLGSVGPPVTGRDVTVAEVLDEAVHWVDIALADQPEVAASVRNTIGNSYRSLGRYREAEDELLSALATRRRLFGDEHVEVAQSLNALALLRRDQGREAEAERLLGQVLRMRRELLGNDDLAVAMALQNLGRMARHAGRMERAQRLLGQALEIRRSRLGDRHSDVAMCQYDLAVLAAQRGDTESARALHQAALRTRRATLHQHHPDVARSLLALGPLLIDSGDPSGAEPYLRECVEIIGRLVPEDHWRLAEARGALGAGLVAMERFEEAEQLLTAAHRALKAARGPDDPRTERVRRHLVQLYQASGRPERAATWSDARAVPDR